MPDRTPVDKQDIVRVNRVTLYVSAIGDFDAGTYRRLIRIGRARRRSPS